MVGTVPARIVDSLSSDDVTVQEGASVSLVCHVTGVPLPEVRWRRKPTASLESAEMLAPSSSPSSSSSSAAAAAGETSRLGVSSEYTMCRLVEGDYHAICHACYPTPAVAWRGVADELHVTAGPTVTGPMASVLSPASGQISSHQAFLPT